MKRAIEESFPIVEINRLAVPERNAFKPIYQMHKWFARRASCVFRAILLSAMKPAGTDIMREFYSDHTDDPDTKGIRILDPFMGGGTTVVEALRLGCDVTGIDLNPVAWFVVKAEVEPVDIDKLEDAFKRLENRMTSSGQPLKKDLLSHYKTECPCCGAGKEDANIIYTFWVKSAICTNPTCRKEVPLFGSYIIMQKAPSIKYLPDYECRACKKTFDLDVDPASFIAEKSLSVNNPRDSAGEGRSNKRWALRDNITGKFICPWCSKDGEVKGIKSAKKPKKKVPLTILLCPHCEAVWQYRGSLPDELICPVCAKKYNPEKGNIPSKGDFICQACGTKDKTITSVRKLPQEQLLPTKPYAIQGYCHVCGGEGNENLLLGGKEKKDVSHSCLISKNNGKFFKKITPADLKNFQNADSRWNNEKADLPYPQQKVPYGEKTKTHLIAHHYTYWHQMFNSRQLLCLSILLKGIDEEEDQILKEMLLTAFFNTLNNTSDFASYRSTVGALRQVFARHDYHPKNTCCENNVWGVGVGMGAFNTWINTIIEGKSFCKQAWDYNKDDKENLKIENDNLKGQYLLHCASSATLQPTQRINLVITDPPYADNVNYSELADYFYVWLRLILAKTYPHFSPEVTPKIEEIIENPTRGKTAEDYEKGLTEAWKRCYESMEDNGIMAFTFHHAEGSAWESLLESICNAGFAIEAIFPIHGESESSLHLIDNQAISYDLIHVCKKRNSNGNPEKRSWAGVRHEIREKARDEIKMIEAGRYGNEKLSPADMNIILIGKCLELYSRHYGAIVDHNNEVVPLQKALSIIRMMVEQLVTTQQPLPSELEHIDPVSYVYLTCLCDRKEIQSDEVNKTTKGIIEVDTLIKAGVIRKGRAKRGRTYEVKHPNERYKELQEIFNKKTKVINQPFLFPEMNEEKFDHISLVDVIHYLMGLSDASENLVPWLNDFRPVVPQVRIALDYLKGRNPTFQAPIETILQLIEV